jgi:putative transposase
VPEAIKTDNGRDYTANQLEHALRGLRIDHPLCAPFSPHQKPHIERGYSAANHLVAQMPLSLSRTSSRSLSHAVP